MESHTPIVVQGGGRFRGVVGPLLSVFFFILRYFEKFLPLYAIVLVAKSARFLAVKKGFKSSFNQLFFFILDIFDQLVGFC